ncbi:MAG: replicative DNA helicase [Oscillospiraceae bacterium]|nr:replicative DNA helicase [Oscillospiraceae bacterium]
MAINEHDIIEGLPFNMEAEQSVLGAVLLNPNTITKTLEHIKPEHFYTDAHKTIFGMMIEMFSFGTPIDYVTIVNLLESSKKWNGQESAKLYLARLMELVPTTENIEDYCKIVLSKYYLRQLIVVSREIGELAREGTAEARSLLDLAESRILEIRDSKETRGLVHIEKIVTSTYDKLEKLYSSGGKTEGRLFTGFEDLDRIMTGLNPSDLIFIAARPGVGKTSLGLNIALNSVRRTDKAVAVFSLEMSNEQLVSRLLSSEARIVSSKFRTGQFDGEDWTKLAKAASVLCSCDIYLDDTTSITVTDIKSRIRQIPNLGLVIIDYLQLMTDGSRYSNDRVKELSLITMSLKKLAKDMDIPVIVLSQLSRASEKRSKDEREPVLSDLRDSGSIEQDADIVIMLHHENNYDREADPGEIKCIVAKNRHGETRSISLKWDGEFTSFSSIENRYE